eukprot:s2238_g20.t1
MAHQTHPDQVQFLAELQRFQDGLWLQEHASNTLIMLDDLTDKLEEIGQQNTVHYQHLQAARTSLRNSESLIRRKIVKTQLR